MTDNWIIHCSGLGLYQYNKNDNSREINFYIQHYNSQIIKEVRCVKRAK